MRAASVPRPRPGSLAPLIMGLLAATAPPAAGMQANLLGHVTDAETGLPIAGAQVTFESTSTTRTTSELGYFTFTQVPVGVHFISVEALGYAPRRVSVTLSEDEAYETEVLLSAEPLEVEGLTVSVIPRRTFNQLRDLDLRLERGTGQFILRKEMVQRGGNLVDLLRGRRGVRIGGAGGGTMANRTVQLRRAAHITSTGPGRYTISDCFPAVFVDGRRYSRRASLGDEPTDLTVFYADEMEAVEVYSGASVPAIIGGGDAACGAILIWTRRGPARRGGS